MIAVTGASGFVGSHFIGLLRDSGKPFICLVRPQSSRKSKLDLASTPHREVNYQDIRSVQNALSGISILVHILGRTNGTDEILKQSNVETTQVLMKAAKAAGLQKIIYVSSVAAMQRHGMYGQTKFEAEEIIRASNIPHLIFRPAYIFGRGDEQNTELMIRVLKQFPIIPLLGGGDFKLQPVYVGDVVRLLMQSLDSANSGKNYTVAGIYQISLKAMLLDLAKALHVKRILIPIPLKPVQAVVRVYSKIFKNSKLPVKQILELNKHEAFDISATRKDFQFEPIPSDDGVKKMFREDKTPCAV